MLNEEENKKNVPTLDFGTDLDGFGFARSCRTERVPPTVEVHCRRQR